MGVSVLLTRPETQSRRFAEALQAAHAGKVAPILAPLQRIEPAPPLPDLPRGAVAVFTSENGVAAFAAMGGTGAGRRAWCVGTRTAAAARAAGFDVRTGPGDARGLAAAILAHDESGENGDGDSENGAGPFVHLHGAHVSGDVAGTLVAAGRAACAHAIYAQVACPMPAAGRRVLDGGAPVIVPVFSARSAALLAPYLAQARAPLALAAISPAVATGLGVQSGATIRVADRPDAAAMVDAVGAFLEERKIS